MNLWHKNLRKNIRVICEIRGFKAKPQILTNYFGLNGVFLNDFTYLCQYAFQKTFRVMTASNKEFLYYSSLEMSASLKAYIQNNYISNGRFFS